MAKFGIIGRNVKTILNLRAVFSVAVFVAACVAFPLRADVETGSGSALDGWYAGASAGIMLPGSGNGLRRAGEVSLSAGRYLSDSLALEGAFSCAPAAASDAGGMAAVSGCGVRALWHVFGYERFDPFVTCGAAARFASRHVFADAPRRTAIGPAFGVGAFYHLTNRWSLRADATASLSVDSPCGLVYSVSAGLQFSFGDE